MNRSIRSLTSLALAALAFTAVLICAVTATTASAALVADYRFENNLESSVGTAPPLTAVGAGATSFQTESVNGVPELVRVFPAGAGLSLATAGLIPSDTYTFEITFRFTEVTAWERIFDATDAGQDNGLYVKTSKLDYYDNHHSGSADHFGIDAFLADTYTTVTIARSSSGQILVHQNGSPQISYADTAGTGVLSSLPDRPARFFIDDNVIGNENAPGAVARIRVFDTNTLPEPAPPGGDKNPTVTRVHCNYLVATGTDTCFAQVADARPGSTKRPGGTVRFSSANGGTFLGGGACELVPTAASPNVSSCSVQYLPSTRSFPRVAANYQGSAEHSSSTGATTFYILGGNGFGVDLGTDPTLGNKASGPIKVGCSSSATKKAASIEISITGNVCMTTLDAAYEAAKNKAIGKPCPDTIKSYSDLKDCNPRYREALEAWEREEEQTKLNLDELIEKRSDLYDELKDIMDDFDKSAKIVIGGMRRSVTPVPQLQISKRRAKGIAFRGIRVKHRSGKLKTVRFRVPRDMKPVLTFVRRMNKALPALDLKVNISLTVKTTRRTKTSKPKRRTVKRVVAYNVAP